MRRIWSATAAAAAVLVMAGSTPAAGADVSWQPEPGPTVDGGALVDVVSTSSTSAWAVGARYNSDEPSDHAAAIVEHWDGGGWAELEDVPTADGFTAISARSDTDLFVSGFLDREFGATRVWHYDGSTWSRLTATGLPATITGRVLAAPGHVWLVGEVDPGHHDAGAVIAAYHGGAEPHWTVNRMSSAGGFYGGAVHSATNVWAVGSTSQYADAGHAVVAHWNGARWKLRRLPFQGQLLDVSIDGARDVMAVGERREGKNEQVPNFPAALAVHFDGHRWSRMLPKGCKYTCRFSAVAGGPHGTYWATSPGGEGLKTASYLYFDHAKWSSVIPGQTQPVAGEGHVVAATGIARVQGTTSWLSVGDYANHSHYTEAEPLRETYPGDG